MSQPTPAQLRLIETGRPAVEKFMDRWRKSRSLGIVAVIAKARKAEADTGIGELQRAADELRLRRDGVVGQPREYLRLDRELTAATRRVGDLLGFADAEVERIWRSRDSLRAVAGDLADLKAAVEAEMERVIRAQVDFAKSNGLGELDRESVAAISPSWQALNEFLNRHLAPMAATAESCSDDPAVNASWNPSEASWVLLGTGWRSWQDAAGPGLIAKLGKTLGGKGGKATSPTPAPDLTVAPATS